MIWITFDRSIDVRGDRRDPDGVETHAMNVVEVFDNAPPVSSAVDFIIGIARRKRAIADREPICHNLFALLEIEMLSELSSAYLVDRARLPVLGGRSEGGSR